MQEELLTLLDRLSPSNQRLIRELVFQLAQLQQLTMPEQHDATLDYTAQVDTWLTHLLNKGRSPRTIEHYGIYVRKLLARYPHPRLTHIDAFLAEATARGNKSVTIAHIASALKSFFIYLQDAELVTTNTASRIQRPSVQRSIRTAPADDQVARILEASKHLRHQAMLELMVDCGLRDGELVTIRISNIDLEHRLLTVTGKRGKQRQVPLGTEVAGIIRKQSEELRSLGYEGDWLFPGRVDSNHVSTCAVWLRLNRLCIKLGLTHITPHQLRHYFATQMLSQGASLKVTSEILGHSRTSTTTDIYWHVLNQKEILDQHDKFSPLGGVREKLSTIS